MRRMITSLALLAASAFVPRAGAQNIQTQLPEYTPARPWARAAFT